MSKQLTLSIELLDSDSSINKKILNAIAEEFNDQIYNKISVIRSKIADGVVFMLKATDIYQSLTNGDLAGHFGLPVNNRTTMVDGIISTVANNLEVEFKPAKVMGGQFVNGISIGVLIKNFTDVLALSEAVVTTSKGQILPWLDWLLRAGNKMIISEHEIHLIGGKGRSGKAIMIKNNASVWRVPTQFSGTINNNWLIRTFTDNADDYLNMISGILKQELQ
jgi:hypothetical protein